MLVFLVFSFPADLLFSPFAVRLSAGYVSRKAPVSIGVVWARLKLPLLLRARRHAVDLHA
ncbi:hypothetical protein OKW43_001940 [Paraburkholderia sp. WC7.3g]